ncbi:hypothetical protein HFN11_35950 [Rhizobium leguminosarum]|uniref:hypothetical protein n=1 Tax=Rhizobium leguminosarum TaxID=384 RepID=UPI0013C833CA|nr:hypothetical protein [Rhizobium leguminosarum]MBY5325584.1 hypothetical protein [Rhizobium leguminosarum]NEI96248.1 hypothetical protein [Rhizobium leguminosarum]
MSVINNTRQEIQQATLNWYQGYLSDARKLKGTSGGHDGQRGARPGLRRTWGCRPTA